MKSNKKYQVALSKLGDEFSVSEDILKDLETYVCELYVQKVYLSVNETRVRIFICGKHDDLCLPSNKKSLMKHINRVKYHAGIHKHCMSQKPKIPLLVGNGWEKVTFENKKETLAIDWMDHSTAPDSILELGNCSCPKIKCATIRCTCHSNKLPYTDLCKYRDYENKSIKHDCITYDQEGNELDNEELPELQ